jgi:hypothetical protein
MRNYLRRYVLAKLEPEAKAGPRVVWMRQASPHGDRFGDVKGSFGEGWFMDPVRRVHAGICECGGKYSKIRGGAGRAAGSGILSC